ncbi:MAG: hypothetical protein ACE5E8_04980 [Acidimicrobiia bacterium]
MLRAARRVSTRGARMCMSVIGVAPGLVGGECAEAASAGPPYPVPMDDYPQLLRRAGWDLLDRGDLTAAYLEAARRHLAAVQRHSDELARLVGSDEGAATQEQRRCTVAAIEAGLLRRQLFTCAAA